MAEKQSMPIKDLAQYFGRSKITSAAARRRKRHGAAEQVEAGMAAFDV